MEFDSHSWVTSKEILLKTGISRATLNNYIRMGIVPRPLVQKPRSDMRGTKKIGYFPGEVLGRIELIRRLKQEGHTMAEIVERLKDSPLEEPGNQTVDSWTMESAHGPSPDHGVLRLTLEGIEDPAYLVNFHFQVAWVNEKAEEKIFGYSVSNEKRIDQRNIFRLFFHWRFHSHVKNWRDLVGFHMAFAKLKYARSWMEKIYPGISPSEAEVLQELYDHVESFRRRTILARVMNFLMEDGSTETYMVHVLFFKEGMLFIYQPEGLTGRRSFDF